MILQALAEYYDRLASENTGGIAKHGFQNQEIPFLIVLRRDGSVAGLQDTRQMEGKKKLGRMFSVPKAVKRASGIAANLLWDTAAYVVGRPKPDTKKNMDDLRARAVEQQQAFFARFKETFLSPEIDEGLYAVSVFLEQHDFEALFKHSSWPEVEGSGAILSFMLEGDTRLICERPVVLKNMLPQEEIGVGETATCLLSGETDIPVRLHTAIKGVWGAQTSGANIVSFNLAAFCSQGKQQGFNAPVGARAEFAYTTALNLLLQKGSKQRVQVGDASTVFWARKRHQLEDVFADIFGEPAKGEEAQDHRQLLALFRSPETGARAEMDPDTRFFVLGLAPNAARIAIRFWYTGTVREVADNILCHFDDLAVVHGPNQPATLSLFRLLVSTAVQGKSENIPPNLAGDLMRAILSGSSYPQTLLSAAVRRCRAEQEVNYPRASLIKAVLARDTRIGSRYQTLHVKEVGMSLDTTNNNAGYRLGRLFATLEKIQEEASPGINATIRDRFYGSASATPVTAFPHLMKLKNHHLAKLDNRGRATNLEKLVGEIMDGLSDFPAHLSLPDQGRFAVGYYHQRQDFFVKKTTN